MESTTWRRCWSFLKPEPTMKSANIKRFDTFNSVKCRIRSKHNHQVDRFHSLTSNYWHTSKKGLLLLIGSVRQILQSGLTSRILHLVSRASIDNLKACTKGVIGSLVPSRLLIIFVSGHGMVVDDHFGCLGERDVWKEGGKRRRQLIDNGTNAIKKSFVFREFTQRQRRLRELQLKSEFALPQT